MTLTIDQIVIFNWNSRRKKLKINQCAIQMYRLTLDKECNMDDYLFVAVCIQIANKIEAEERILLLGAIGCFFYEPK